MDGTWIYELGSNHLGKIEIISRTLEFIRQYRSVHYDIVLKLQLFPNEPKYTDSGNYYVDKYFFRDAAREAITYGLPLAASVFDLKCMDMLLEEHPLTPFIKIAYSQKHNHELVRQCAMRKHTIVSCDHLTKHQVFKHNNIWHLYCLPFYPVPFHVRFDPHMFKMFDGFSDHTIGIKDTIAAKDNGARIIEKHVLPPDHGKYTFDCPDATFAVTARDFMRCISRCKTLSQTSKSL